MSCSWDRSTERYSECDGASQCYCIGCKKCGNTVQFRKSLSMDGLCKSCEKHYTNKFNKVTCGHNCYVCDVEADIEIEKKMAAIDLDDLPPRGNCNCNSFHHNDAEYHHLGCPQWKPTS